MLARKIILTIYFLSGLAYWMYWLSTSDPCLNDSYALFHSCFIQHFVFDPLCIYIILGVPTGVLLLIWKKRKEKVE